MNELLESKAIHLLICSVLCLLLLEAFGWGEEATPEASAREDKPSKAPEAEQAIVAPEASENPMLALDTVVALVNGEAITLDDLERQSNPFLAAWRQRVSAELWPRIRERILRVQLETLIDRKLILLEAKALGARIDESRVREAILSLPELRNTFEGDLSKYLVAKGLTYHQLSRDIEEQLLFNAMVREKVLPKVRVAPAEVQQYYQRNIERFTEEAAIHCYAITFMKGENLEAGANVLTKAREALRKVHDGAYFPDVAKEYSEDPVRAEKGGDWGWITPGALEKKASEAAFALKEGEYSGLVEGDAAYWILWVKEKRETSVIPLTAAWKEIESGILAQKRDIEIRRWGQRLRLNAAITYPVPLSGLLGQ
jgi:peptidyl-prolyl cis-trans isomerase SurA